MGSKVSDPRGIAVRQNGKVIGDFGNLVNIPTGKYAASGGLKDVVNDNIDALDAGNKLAVIWVPHEEDKVARGGLDKLTLVEVLGDVGNLVNIPTGKDIARKAEVVVLVKLEKVCVFGYEECKPHVTKRRQGCKGWSTGLDKMTLVEVGQRYEHWRKRNKAENFAKKIKAKARRKMHELSNPLEPDEFANMWKDDE
ncbi:hypothetical protein DY000_02030496 [Brassica cretica]|uniref:DUF4283 domain-containing protein n=1 Tax=Brassica cretica TaxID=69181 RepID=A0ABQ7DT34_BRACR|nr:hypothetical protein DY000_02030496 [Brassica cretica]